MGARRLHLKDASAVDSARSASAGRRSSCGDESTVTLGEPVMAEVSAESTRTAHAFRHSVRFVQLRPWSRSLATSSGNRPQLSRIVRIRRAVFAVDGIIASTMSGRTAIRSCSRRVP